MKCPAVAVLWRKHGRIYLLKENTIYKPVVGDGGLSVVIAHLSSNSKLVVPGWS